MRSNDLWLVQENHITVKPGSSSSSASPGGMKTYRESRIELRNLKIFKKMLEKSSQFLSNTAFFETENIISLNEGDNYYVKA